jgi:hypothetical protein
MGIVEKRGSWRRGAQYGYNGDDTPIVYEKGK